MKTFLSRLIFVLLAGAVLILTPKIFPSLGQIKTQKAANYEEALTKAAAITDDRERVDYLVKEARRFMQENQLIDAGETINKAMDEDRWGLKEIDELMKEIAVKMIIQTQ